MGSNEDDSNMLTRFERVVDNRRFRMFFAGFLVLVYLLDLVLAAMSFHIYPSVIYGALAYQIILCIVTAVYTFFFVWRNLEGCSKKRIWVYAAGNLVTTLLWLGAFFALIVMMTMGGSSSNSSSSSNSGSNGSSNSGSSSRRLRRATSNNSGPTGNFLPAVGCVVIDLFVVGAYIVNQVYIYLRTRQLFPKYAELNDDGNAFDAQMQDVDHDHDDPETGGPPQAYATYDAHGEGEHYGGAEGANQDTQDRYDQYEQSQQAPYSQSPPGRYNEPPPGRYNQSPQGRYNDPSSQGQGRYDLSPNRRGNTAYGQGPPTYPQPAAQYEDAATYGDTAYAPHPEQRLSPSPGRVPYPRDRDSVIQ